MHCVQEKGLLQGSRRDHHLIMAGNAERRMKERRKKERRKGKKERNKEEEKRKQEEKRKKETGDKQLLGSILA